MKVRYLPDPIRFCRMTTQEVRENFLIESLFVPDEIEMVYSDVDRAIAGSAVPVKSTLSLTSADELRADYFCQRRELLVFRTLAPLVVSLLTAKPITWPARIACMSAAVQRISFLSVTMQLNLPNINFLVILLTLSIRRHMCRSTKLLSKEATIVIDTDAAAKAYDPMIFGGFLEHFGRHTSFLRTYR